MTTEWTPKYEWPRKKRPMPKGGQTPYGYMDDPEDDTFYWMIPNPEIMPFLEEAMDRISDNGSLREISDWLTVQTKKPITHMGLKKIWDRTCGHLDTPRSRRRAQSVADIKKAAVRERNLTKGRKIAIAKNRLRAQEKKVEKLEQKYKDEETLRQNKLKREEQGLRVNTTSKIALDFEIDGPPTVKTERPVIFEPNPGPQTDFLSTSCLEALYGGSAGGGKSYALLGDPIRYFENPNFVGLLIRRTNDELRELKWESQKLYPKIFKTARWKEKDSLWVFPSGAKMWFSYLDRDEDVLRYQGQAFSWIGVDELTQYPTPFAWNYLRSRLRSKDEFLKHNLSMRATTNPGGPGHGWVKKMFVDPAPAGTPFWARDIDTGEVLVDSQGKPLFKRVFIQASLKDNPYLADDGIYERNLLSLPEDQRRKLLDGDWSVSEGAAFPEFSQAKHTIEPFDIPPDWKRFRSCDFGYSSYSAVHWFAIDPNLGTLYVYRELYVSKKTAKDLALIINSIEQRNGERMSYGVLDSSCWHKRGQTGPSIAEEMISEGCRWRPSDRTSGSRTARKNRLHELLKINEDTNVPGILFFNTCRQIISDLEVIPSDPHGEDDIDARYASDHAYDSIGYGIMSRPKPGFAEFWDLSSSPSYTPVDSTFGY